MANPWALIVVRQLHYTPFFPLLKTQLVWRQYKLWSLWQFLAKFFAKNFIAWALPIEFACGWEQMKWKSNHNIKLCSDCNTQYGYTPSFLACFVRQKLRQGARQGWDLRELARQKTYFFLFFSIFCLSIAE